MDSKKRSIDRLEAALIEQNPHWSGRKYTHAFQRKHDREAISDLSLQEIQVITGIRRCGKSTLLQTQINALMQDIDPRSILYLNFDDPNYTEIYTNAAKIADLVLAAEKITQQSTRYVFMDEVQNVSAWEQYVKSVYDSQRFTKIVISGSNGDLLKSDYATLLSGRFIERHLYPLSFQEILLNYGITDKLTLAQQKPKVLAIVDELLEFGSFPRIFQIAQTAQKRKVLQSYYDTILLKDCILNHQVRDTKLLMTLTHYILNNITSLYSYNSLGKAIGSNENTIQQFLQHLQNAYFIDELRQYAYSLKTQSRAKKKPYCIDNGLINVVTFRFSQNAGILLENLVYTELKKNGFSELYYFNDEKECDFIIHKRGAPMAIQVCYELTAQNQKRELYGLEAAMKTFNIEQGVIITYNQTVQLTEQILAVPFHTFFFEQ